MAQILIVEGNDAIALTAICKKRGLRPPLGYESESKFKEEFVKKAGGYVKALSVLEDSLDNSSIDNIGIIVDANDVGPLARWQAIRSILADKYAEETLIKADQHIGYKIIQEEKLPTIGVWIMPDNVSNGYLEHFLAGMIPETEVLWNHAFATVDNLLKEEFNVLTKAKVGKARLHTWLAWKENPGKPFGQAVDARYFNVGSESVDLFIEWFKSTFE